MAHKHRTAWIVITGSIIDTTRGGGLEFFGPFFTPEAAEEWLALTKRNRSRFYDPDDLSGGVFQVLQLLKPIWRSLPIMKDDPA